MKLLLLFLLIACGKTIKTGSVEKTQEPAINSTQFSTCTAPRNSEIIYAGVPCRFRRLIGSDFEYICANNRIILMNCQGVIL